jgi:hypothetical protein
MSMLILAITVGGINIVKSIRMLNIGPQLISLTRIKANSLLIRINGGIIIIRTLISLDLGLVPRIPGSTVRVVDIGGTGIRMENITLSFTIVTQIGMLRGKLI